MRRLKRGKKSSVYLKSREPRVPGSWNIFSKTKKAQRMPKSPGNLKYLKNTSIEKKVFISGTRSGELRFSPFGNMAHIRSTGHRQLKKKLIVTILGLIIITGSSSCALRLLQPPPAPDVHEQHQLPNKIAILPFVNRTSNPEAGPWCVKCFTIFSVP